MKLTKYREHPGFAILVDEKPAPIGHEIEVDKKDETRIGYLRNRGYGTAEDLKKIEADRLKKKADAKKKQDEFKKKSEQKREVAKRASAKD
jgi:hypothetical protein